ncbi:MAG: hypothetical protein ABJA67_10610 [Chthonomonadales bacterium]
MYYSEPRFTKDLDLWVDTDRNNAENVYKALAEFGAPLGTLTPLDFEQEGFFFSMGMAPL